MHIYIFRFDQPTKQRIIDFILGSALKFSNYGKVGLFTLALFVDFLLLMISVVVIVILVKDSYIQPRLFYVGFYSKLNL